MKKFLIRLLVFLILSYITGFLLQTLIDRGLKKEHSTEYSEWNDIFQSKINADILIQGNSRAVMQFSPHIIDSACSPIPYMGTKGWNSYNLGIEAYGFYMQYYRFLIYIKYNKAPKYIIQNIDPMTLVKGDTLINYLQFLPYLDNDIIKKAVTTYHGFDWRDFYVPLYKYQGNYNLALKGLLDNFPKVSNFGKDDKNGYYKGFHTNNWDWDKTAFGNFKKMYPKGYRIIADKVTLDLLGRFLDSCKIKGITVIFVCAPEYIQAQKMLLNRDSVMNIFRNYSTLYHIPLFDYSNDSICLDTANFYNSQHLNTGGVRKFNHKLVGDLKGIIK